MTPSTSYAAAISSRLPRRCGDDGVAYYYKQGNAKAAPQVRG